MGKRESGEYAIIKKLQVAVKGHSYILNKAFRFSAQQLERDATNMIRRAENAMRTKWANTNNAFK